MMNKHVMIDLETLGTASNSVILSIGAVAFDPQEDVLPKDQRMFFTRNINIQSCLDADLTVSGDTIRWWFDQSSEARDALRLDQIPLKIAMKELTEFLHVACDHDTKSLRVWSHGSNFDIVLLDNAYRAVDMTPPWVYNGMFDTRTLYAVAGVTLKDITMCGTLHNALADAMHQALVVQLAVRRLELRGPHIF